MVLSSALAGTTLFSLSTLTPSTIGETSVSDRGRTLLLSSSRGLCSSCFCSALALSLLSLSLPISFSGEAGRLSALPAAPSSVLFSINEFMSRGARGVISRTPFGISIFISLLCSQVLTATSCQVRPSPVLSPSTAEIESAPGDWSTPPLGASSGLKLIFLLSAASST